MLLYLFSDFLLSTRTKKKWKMKNGPRLPTRHYPSYVTYRLELKLYKLRNSFPSIIDMHRACTRVQYSLKHFSFLLKLFLPQSNREIRSLARGRSRNWQNVRTLHPHVFTFCNCIGGELFYLACTELYRVVARTLK